MINPSDLKTRSLNIRMPAKLVAERAGMNHDAVCKVLNQRKDSRRSSHERISSAIEQEERAILAYLLTLYPAPAGDQAHA